MKKQRDRVPDSMETQYEESEKDESSSAYSSSEDVGNLKNVEEEEEIEKELADVTFEELQKARSNGTHAFFQKPKEDKKLKRANKNRPMEASSKKPVSGFREVIQAPKKVVRDPRFESLCGKLDPEGFRKRYNFLYENDLPAERQALKKELKKYKDPKRINEIEERVSWIDKQLKSDSAKHIDAEILAKHKKKEREATKQGKRPFYLKKSEIRKQRLIEKYNHLKSSGKLEAFVEKRRRRNAAKDHRYMPYRRSGDVE
ncbi:Ribosomal RNA processing protein 36 like [Glycine soja]|nr:Ribosomal RNA processing protein 36 like [Glycine soja]